MRPSNLMSMLVGCFLFALVSTRFSTIRIETHPPFYQTQVIATPAPLLGHKIIDATWTIPNTANDPPLKLNGTIEQVNALLARDHPHLLKRNVVTNVSSLHTRDVTEDPVWRPSSLWCPAWNKKDLYNLDPAMQDAVNWGHDYLDKTVILPSVDAGPRVCSRVSCRWNFPSEIAFS